MEKNFATLSKLKLPKGATALLRVDFNEQITRGRATSDFRITRALPTLSFLQKRALRIVLLTHLEQHERTPSLCVLAERLRRYPPLRKLQFISGTDRADIRRRIARSDAPVILLENTRCFRGEEQNSAALARFFAGLGDAFVFDAFAVAHRRHASVVGIAALLPSYAGNLFCQEVRQLGQLFKPPRPFLLILGGKKTTTKLPLLRAFQKKADAVFLGGAAANSFFARRGFSVGDSYVEHEAIGIISAALAQSRRILLPEDVVVRRNKKRRTVRADEVGSHDEIMDIGPATVLQLGKKISESRAVLWNGPMGLVEGGFVSGTDGVAKAVRALRGLRVVGGGDTVAFLHAHKLLSAFDFVSTGGGAMLDFLADGTLPALEALAQSNRQFHPS